MAEAHAPRPEASSPTRDADLLAARLLARVCAVVAMGAFVAWFYDGEAGWNTFWDRYAAVTMSGIYALSALALWRRPRAIDLIVGGTLGATGVYFLGSLYVAASLDSAVGLYSMSSNAQFMPLVYVGAFVAMRRGAWWLSWAHYAAIVVLYLWLFGLSEPPANRPFSAMSAHVWVVLLFIHPACILALQYIVKLKGRLQRAEVEAHQGKERFLIMLSHEIRTPLQAMLGSIDLLAMKVRGEPERRAVDRLRHAATQLDAHLRDVTEYTRLDSPNWRLHPERTNLVSLVQQVCDLMAPQAERQGLALHCEVAPTDEPALQAIDLDPIRVRQILVNLLSNALKYTLTGDVTVRASLAKGPQPSVCLEVRDTGIGIPPEELNRIFEPYVRLEDERVLRAGGSGLGLAVVQRLVNRLGGQMKVDSTLDLGSCFTVTLPQLGRQ